MPPATKSLLCPVTNKFTTLCGKSHVESSVKVKPVPSQKPERVDPRVTRTKAELKRALSELMTNRRWDKIRVQDILERTGISRSAFYSHYGGKYELLMDGVPELHIPLHDSGRPDFLPLFLHIEEVAHIMRPLLSQPVAGDVMGEFHRSIVELWRSTFTGTPDAENWVLHEMLAGGVMAVAKAYVMQRDMDDPAAVASEVEEQIDHLLSS